MAKFPCMLLSQISGWFQHCRGGHKAFSCMPSSEFPSAALVMRQFWFFPWKATNEGDLHLCFWEKLGNVCLSGLKEDQGATVMPELLEPVLNRWVKLLWTLHEARRRQTWTRAPTVWRITCYVDKKFLGDHRLEFQGKRIEILSVLEWVLGKGWFAITPCYIKQSH